MATVWLLSSGVYEVEIQRRNEDDEVYWFGTEAEAIRFVNDTIHPVMRIYDLDCGVMQ